MLTTATTRQQQQDREEQLTESRIPNQQLEVDQWRLLIPSPFNSEQSLARTKEPPATNNHLVPSLLPI